MGKKDSKYSTPTKSSRTRVGIRPNDSKRKPVPGTGRNRPAKGYNPETKTWNQ